MERNSLDKAYNLACFFLKFRPRTVREIKKYLGRRKKRFKFDSETINQVVNRLKEEGFLNDYKFIEWFVESRIRSVPKGQLVLIKELKTLGISRELIESYFQKNPLDENNLALIALRKAWFRWRNLLPDNRYKKASRFLTRRGFSWAIIKNAIAQVEEKG